MTCLQPNLKGLLTLNFRKAFFTISLLFTFFSLPFSPVHSLSSPSSKPIRISLSQVIDHPALNETTKGIVDGLAKSGYREGENLILDIEMAEGKPAVAMQIAQKFAGNNPDVMVGIGTTSAQTLAVVGKVRNIPVIFATVTDPVGAKLIRAGRPITGVSNYTEQAPQFKMFKQMIPNLQKLGIIYNPGEANSQSLLLKSIEIGKQLGIEIIPSPAVRTSDVPVAARQLVGQAQAIFINNDNTALAAFQTVVKLGEENKLPVFVSDTDLVSDGAFAALGPNQYELGLQAAKLIVRVLKGEDASTIPFEYPQKLEKKVNPKAALKMGVCLD